MLEQYLTYDMRTHEILQRIVHNRRSKTMKIWENGETRVCYRRKDGTPGATRSESDLWGKYITYV
jgi:hypothetical protein